MIRVARVEGKLWQESVVDGPGVRLVLFLAGCIHNCPGCHNAWLQDPTAGEAVREQEVVAELQSSFLPAWHDGITISGGDPFYQSIELATLLALVRRSFPVIDTWVYTGALYEELEGEPALYYCNTLVDGPFIALRANEGQNYRGSGNQRLIPLQQGKWQINNWSEVI